MLNMGMSNFNFNATSVATEDEESKVAIATFGASYSGDQVYFNYNIINQDLYFVHADETNADFEEFKKNVLKSIGEVK
jgi:hypothetical protein